MFLSVNSEQSTNKTVDVIFITRDSNAAPAIVDTLLPLMQKRWYYNVCLVMCHQIVDVRKCQMVLPALVKHSVI